MNRNDLRKKRKSPGRTIQMLTALLLLIVVGILLLYFSKPEDIPEISDAYTYGELLQHETAQVNAVSVTLRSGDCWTIVKQNELYALLQDDDFAVNQSTAEMIVNAASVISYDRILTDDPTEYRNHLSDFGLDSPKAVIHIQYTDQTTCTMQIGNKSGIQDETWSYMTIDGDERLFAIDRGTVEIFDINRSVLHEVEQPVIHKARLDDIRLINRDGTEYRWTLETDITSDDAAHRWRVISPFLYPADGEAMDKMRTNLSQLRMGAYVADATEENLRQYGFDAPRLTIVLHQAQGIMNATDENGSIIPREWPEETVTISIGGKKNENVDYVCWNDRIYTTSHFTLGVFMNILPISTVSRYPVMIPLETLKMLSVKTQGETVTWNLQREIIEKNEENIENRTLVKCYQNHCEVSYDWFQAAYARLMNVTVSGILPQNTTLSSEAHTTYTFVSDLGETHTVELLPFDALHDAVAVDGTALFYLIRGGMVFKTMQETP